jgi:hypothetical protein
MKLFLQIFLFFILVSCQSNENKNLESKISGKWIFVEEYFITRYNDEGFEEPPPPPIENLGFYFFSKDSCEANQMFVDLKTKDVDYWKKLGRKTIYKVDKDSLKVFNRTLNVWQSASIMKLDHNNLVLNYGNLVIKKFVRVIKE